MEKSGGFYRPDHGRNPRLRLRLGQLPVVHRRNAGLAHTESKRRAEPQIPRRRGSAESEVGSRGAHHHPKEPNEHPVLCKRL